MTCRRGDTATFKAKVSHQELFGRFLSLREQGISDLDLWSVWGADNGAFTGFDQDRFMRKLKAVLPNKSTCRFITVPDIPFCWEPTLVKFQEWSPSIRRMGFPLALAVQDGATVENIPWHEIDAIFIGGSTEWKRCKPRVVGNIIERPTIVRDIVAEAKVRGKWVHVGRSANAPKQLWYAYDLGADSVDGTRERYAPDKEFKKWITQTMWEIHKLEGGL